jgi:hypothetical protein
MNELRLLAFELFVAALREAHAKAAQESASS